MLTRTTLPALDLDDVFTCILQVIVDPVIDPPEGFPGDLRPVGNRWKAVGRSPPSNGQLLGELDGSKPLDDFATAEITEEEIASLGVQLQELRVNHCIKVRAG